jgi:hypothetical protein
MSNRIKGKVDDSKTAREGLLELPIFDQATDLIAYGVIKTSATRQYPIEIMKGDYKGCNYVVHDWVNLEPHLKTLCSRNGLELDLNQTVQINGQVLLVEYALLYYSQVSADTRLYYAAKFIMGLREYYLWANGLSDVDVVETLLRYGDSKTSFVASLSQSTFVKGIMRSADAAKGGEASSYTEFYETVITPLVTSYIYNSYLPSHETMEQFVERLSSALLEAGCRHAHSLDIKTVRRWRDAIEKELVKI